MNECITTPQDEKQIGNWVSEQGVSEGTKKNLTMHSIHFIYGYMVLDIW